VTYDVKVWHGTIEHHVVVSKATSAEQAMEQALVILKISFQSVNKMEASERP
jgi:hypothetical protein